MIYEENNVCRRHFTAKVSANSQQLHSFFIQSQKYMKIIIIYSSDDAIT